MPPSPWACSTRAMVRRSVRRSAAASLHVSRHRGAWVSNHWAALVSPSVQGLAADPAPLRNGGQRQPQGGQLAGTGDQVGAELAAGLGGLHTEGCPPPLFPSRSAVARRCRAAAVHRGRDRGPRRRLNRPRRRPQGRIRGVLGASIATGSQGCGPAARASGVVRASGVDRWGIFPPCTESV